MEPTPGSPTADVTGMEAEEVGTAEPMGGSGQEAEIGAGAADLRLYWEIQEKESGSIYPKALLQVNATSNK